MMKNITITYIFIVIILAVSVNAATPDCYLNAPGVGEPVCGDGFTQRGLVSLHGHFTPATNALAPYSLCCSDFFIPDAGENTFRFAEVPGPPTQISGHTGSPTSSFIGEVWVGSKQCTYRAGGCVGDEACIFKVSDEFGTTDNSHIGDCNDNTLPIDHHFGLSLCCQIAEACMDGIDNDGDGYIDCADEECNPLPDPVHGVSPQECDPGGQGHLQDTRYCINNPGDCTASDGERYYCGYQLSDDPAIDPVGFCCPDGFYPKDIGGGIWRCFGSAQCGVGATRDCKVDFDTSQDDWLMSVYDPSTPNNWCNSRIPHLHAPTLEPYSGSTGCCLIPKYARIDYWLDENNVVIYG